MKRLKSKLLAMPKDEKTYAGMYDASILKWYGTPPEKKEFDPIYYNDDIGFKITATHKYAQDKPTVTVQIPIEKLRIRRYSIAIADYCLRAFIPYVENANEYMANRGRPDEENGKIYVHHPGGEILTRNTSYFAECKMRDYEYSGGNSVRMYAVSEPRKMCLCIRLLVQLPKNKIRKTIEILCNILPTIVGKYIDEFKQSKLAEIEWLSEKQIAIREWIKNSDYCCFIANGSILPREENTDMPMKGALPFKSPKQDEIEISGIRGMGIRKGVTLITGGGYSGKTTLLNAISSGIYDHVYGDGRELCITDDTAMTISAEDGRSVKSVNISPFIKWLQRGDTHDFSTDRASGATSQATNIMEAVDYGAKLLLIDEDRSATNFMIRDKMMKELIKKEPITPFTDRVNEIYKLNGVSTILVIGGSGEYLAVADKIYLMDDFSIHDVTAQAKKICELQIVTTDFPSPTVWKQNRTLYADGFSSYPEGSGSEKLEVSDMGYIIIGDEHIDIRGLHDVRTRQQLDALGYMLRYLETHNIDRKIKLDTKIDELYNKIEQEGLDTVFSSYFTTTERFLDLPRKQELKACINRMRKIKIKAGDVE